jgi:hypothetical protein
MNAGSPLNEIMALRAALAQAEARADAAEADAAQAKAKASSDQAFIAYLKLEIEKLRRDLYGVRSERKARLLDQLELQLEELEATTSWLPNRPPRRPRRSRRSPAGSRYASRSPTICRASASSFRPPPAAPAAVRTNCASLARRSPRRWRAFRASGR